MRQRSTPSDGANLCPGSIDLAVSRGNDGPTKPGDSFDLLSSEEERMDPIEQPPGIVRLTRGLEETDALDRPVQALEPLIETVFGTGTRGSVLRGEWLGHAVHPLLTDVVLGTWTSASLLDLFGGSDSSTAARRLVAHRSPCCRPHRLDRVGRVVGGRAARQAGGPRPRRDQCGRDRRLRGVLVRPPTWPARARGRARACRGCRLRSRRLPGRTPGGGTQGGEPPPGVQRRWAGSAGGRLVLIPGVRATAGSCRRPGPAA